MNDTQMSLGIEMPTHVADKPLKINKFDKNLTENSVDNACSMEAITCL